MRKHTHIIVKCKCGAEITSPKDKPYKRCPICNKILKYETKENENTK